MALALLPNDPSLFLVNRGRGHPSPFLSPFEPHTFACIVNATVCVRHLVALRV